MKGQLNNKKWVAIMLLVVALICGLVWITWESPKEISDTSIKLIETQTSKLELYDVKRDGSKELTDPEKFEWKSSNEKVATIDEDGVVTAVGEGETEIQAVCKRETLACKVKVKEMTLSVTKKLSLDEGEDQKLEVTTNLKGAKNDVVYKSSNKKVATVNKKGKVTAVGSGKATITAELAGKTAKCEVKVVGLYDFPKVYQDKTAKITITREWFKSAWVYAAHIEYSDYDRLKSTTCSGGNETVSQAHNRLGALLTINGDYSADHSGGIVRNGEVLRDYGYCDAPGVYNQATGVLEYGMKLGGSLSSLAKEGRITDTFNFCHESVYILDGVLQPNRWGHSRAQRTFMGTNGKAGDIWLCVSDGRYNDGESAGLTYLECGEYLQTKGCTFALPLDGGGSSTMNWKGNVLNAERGHERAVVDYVYFQ